MEFTDLISAVAAGNLLTLCVVWGMQQFAKHDEDAPWLAYGAVLMPMFLIIASLVLNEGLTPHFDALAPK